MLKRIPAILSVLVIVFLNCTQSAHIVGAEEKVRPMHPGTTLVECKILNEDPNDPIYMKVIRNRKSLCADEVWRYKTNDCSGTGEQVIPSDDKRKPEHAYSGTGNQFCPEALVVYVNSPPCYQFTTGGRTYYLPRSSTCPPP